MSNSDDERFSIEDMSIPVKGTLRVINGQWTFSLRGPHRGLKELRGMLDEGQDYLDVRSYSVGDDDRTGSMTLVSRSADERLKNLRAENRRLQARVSKLHKALLNERRERIALIKRVKDVINTPPAITDSKLEAL